MASGTSLFSIFHYEVHNLWINVALVSSIKFKDKCSSCFKQPNEKHTTMLLCKLLTICKTKSPFAMCSKGFGQQIEK